MRITRKVRFRILAATVAAGAIGLTAAGASAFTNSNSFSNTNTTVGYGSQTVTGATVLDVQYGLSSDGSTINSVTITTNGDTAGSAASVGFTVGGVAGATTACGAGTFTTNTVYVCSGLTQALSGIQATNIVVD